MKVSDKISKEFEARANLSESEFLIIKNDYTKSQDFKSFTQTNIYYDVNELFLTNNGMVLRVRVFDNDSELTLKIKTKDFDKEITVEKINKDADIKKLLTPAMKEVLNNIDIKFLKEVGRLTTERTEIKFDNYLIAIDKNYYNNKVDYNLEIEASSKEEANIILNNILKKYGVINNTIYISKSRRAIFNS